MKKCENTVRLVSILLCFVMLGMLLVSCKDDQNRPDTDSGQDSVSTEEYSDTELDTDEKGYIKDSIGKVDLEGKEINILGRTESHNYLWPKTASQKDIVQNEVYLRNIELQEKYNVTLTQNLMSGNWQNNPADRELLNIALTGADGYDLITSYSLWPPIMAIRGILLNLHNYDYPDFDKPWWPETMKENWTQHGSIFYVANNSSVLILHSITVTYANLPMLDDYGVTDLFQTVIDGKWTLEKLKQYTTMFHGNALNEKDSSDFGWGLVVDDESRMDAFYYGAGFASCKNGADGRAELAYTSQSQLDAITKFIDELITIFETPEATIFNDSRQAMLDKKTAFMVCSLGSIMAMTNDETYAAIPMPKLDEEQKVYESINNNAYDVWCIPTAASDPEISALLIEAFASSDYRHIGPYFFEKYLTGRYAVSWQGAEIFELIRKSVKLDFGRTGAGTSVAECEAVRFLRPCFKGHEDNLACENIFVSELAKANGNRQLEIALRGALEEYRKLSSVK